MIDQLVPAEMNKADEHAPEIGDGLEHPALDSLGLLPARFAAAGRIDDEADAHAARGFTPCLHPIQCAAESAALLHETVLRLLYKLHIKFPQLVGLPVPELQRRGAFFLVTRWSSGPAPAAQQKVAGGVDRLRLVKEIGRAHV